MVDEYQKLIAEHDGTLAFLRRQWLSADPEDKGKYSQRIDAALDERLRLMKLRDQAKAA